MQMSRDGEKCNDICNLQCLGERSEIATMTYVGVLSNALPE